MALKTFKPYTPSRRFLTMLDKSEITKETPEKSLVESKKRTGGRNAQGEITIWHRGGGHAKKYRIDRFSPRQNGHSRRRSRRSNTIRTARRESRCCTTRTARSATSFSRSGSKWA